MINNLETVQKQGFLSELVSLTPFGKNPISTLNLFIRARNWSVKLFEGNAQFSFFPKTLDHPIFNKNRITGFAFLSEWEQRCSMRNSSEYHKLEVPTFPFDADREMFSKLKRIDFARVFKESGKTSLSPDIVNVDFSHDFLCLPSYISLSNVWSKIQVQGIGQLKIQGSVFLNLSEAQHIFFKVLLDSRDVSDNDFRITLKNGEKVAIDFSLKLQNRPYFFKDYCKGVASELYLGSMETEELYIKDDTLYVTLKIGESVKFEASRVLSPEQVLSADPSLFK